MPPPPAPVEKLLAFLRGFTGEERVEIGKWLAEGELDKALVRAAFRAEEAAGGGDAGPRAMNKGEAQLARTLLTLGRPATVAAAAGKSDAWVYYTAKHAPRMFAREPDGRRLKSFLYRLTDEGRAALEAETPDAP